MAREMRHKTGECWGNAQSITIRSYRCPHPIRPPSRHHSRVFLRTGWYGLAPSSHPTLRSPKWVYVDLGISEYGNLVSAAVWKIRVGGNFSVRRRANGAIRGNL